MRSLLLRPLLVALFMLSMSTALPASTETTSIETTSLELDLPRSAERVWLGSDLWANRLQDWRLRDGAIECLEARPEWPMRTAHILPAWSDDLRGAFSIVAHVDTVSGGMPIDGALVGVLIGVGGRGIDHRLTAMAHHRPAEDGGLFVAIDDHGNLTARDFSASSSAGGLWGIGGRLASDDLAEVAPISRAGSGIAGRLFRSLRLEVRASQEEHGCQVFAVATDPAGKIVSAITVDVPPHQVDGGIALASHLGADGAGFRFHDISLEGSKLHHDPARRFGPVLCALHTLSDGVLNLTAQMGPLGPRDSHLARLELQDLEGHWRTAAAASLDEDSNTFRFRVPGWDATKVVPYRVVYDEATRDGERRTSYAGVVRAEPTADTFTVAAFTGHKTFTGGLKWNHDGVWFPHGELTQAVRDHRPDFLFFSGDQVYEGDLTPAVYAPEDAAIHDYLYKWYRWCWAFRDLARDLPCVTIPDDHDVYHGNIWGAGGIATAAGKGMAAQDSGGYKMSARFVNMVHRTQVSNLPASSDPAPIARGITAYHTRVEYAGVSFAVLADRMFKSSPTVAVPDGQVVNGWFQAPGFDPKTQSDTDGAVLLGDRQLRFLDDWATDWSRGAWWKVVLSQTIFANIATLPEDAKSDGVVPSLPFPTPDEYPSDDKIAADCDSNGWPRTGRDRAVRAIRKGFALHIAGDQHLGSTVRYGVDEWNDAGYALCVPSIANTWPRRWFPPQPGAHAIEGQPPYTGQFEDGFGNKVSVFAVSNPRTTEARPENLHSRVPGYGIVKLHRQTHEAEVAAWPRHVDPTAKDAAPYAGWPIQIRQEEGYGRRALGWLPAIVVEDMEDPVFRITHEATGEVVYALRIVGRSFRAKVFAEGTYTVEVGEPGTARWRRFEKIGMSPVPRGAVEIRIGDGGVTGPAR